MPYSPTILTNGTADADEIRGYLGVVLGSDSVDIPDSVILTSVILGQAESVITYFVELQASNGVPSVSDILAGTSPATAADKVYLHNATVCYAAKLLCPSLTNALNVSVNDGGQAMDRGGIGQQWTIQEQRCEATAIDALRKITNWQRYRTIPAS